MAQAEVPWMKRMRERASVVQDRMRGFATSNRIDLYGKNAVVEPGQSFIGRLLPRWDLKEVAKVVKGQVVYEVTDIFLEAFVHWWTGPDGKRRRDWCLRSLNPQNACPLCEASFELQRSNDQNERKAGGKLSPRENFLFNFLLGKTGQRAANEAGEPDIRYLPATGTIFADVARESTGGGDGAQEFAKGDLSNIYTGYDVMLTRPQTDSGDEWTVTAAAKPSPVFTQEELSRWPNWMDYLVDLPEALKGELRSYDALYERYYGAPPGPGMVSSEQAEPETAEPQAAGSFGGEGEGVDEEFFPPQQERPPVDPRRLSVASPQKPQGRRAPPPPARGKVPPGRRR